ncbi:hypothetical protein RBH26_03275 [Natronolimnohabitans sp. A-GB9]|uniref:hypothetical protein n=1 Tax=Natronolimnohabitans sp. A-GB9 TaxID=3069757 RepID=UPI0027B3A8F3|nr:hypothetical protein [Natronolimnohabitans sp. A-GB9]MDQ2049497.1 hypothetical protein [Natronolimnohabitans sp. A-GB9]
MSAGTSWIRLPIVHALVVIFLVAPLVWYGILFSGTVFGVPAVWLALNLYLVYLVYRVVVGVERIAFEA